MSRRKGESKKSKVTRDQQINPVVHVRVSAWTRAALRALVDHGTYKTLGQAIDRIVKRALAGDGETQVTTIPRNNDDIDAYFPILANDMPDGVFGALNLGDKRLCVMVAFYPELNDVVVAKMVNCGPERVRLFRVSDVGVEAVTVGEGRYLLAERLRYWKRMIRQAEDVYHPHAKQSDTLLARELFPAKKTKEVLQRIQHEDSGGVAQSTGQIDADFLQHAARLSMTPARFVRMMARSQDRDVLDVVDEMLASLDVSTSSNEDALAKGFTITNDKERRFRCNSNRNWHT
ncbi:MAG: hypothetical protein IH951_15880 [Bacteroidetes bacterium]|nr:hypothetical protein [Bacteroidota bacterium]